MAKRLNNLDLVQSDKPQALLKILQRATWTTTTALTAPVWASTPDALTPLLAGVELDKVHLTHC